jgi:Ni,Fe-hydrogenase I cytochrome b subunit
MSLFQFLANTIRVSPNDIGISDPVKEPSTLVANFLVPVYTWAGVICVIIIIIAGYFFVTSAGNASNVKRAKDAILGAVIGLVVIMMAFIITQFVIVRF